MNWIDDQGRLTRRTLGKTGLEVTPLAFGTAGLGNMPATYGYEVDEEQALPTLRAIFASEVNFVDTAAHYGDGESERRIGLALRERGGLPRGWVLNTKHGRIPGQAEGFMSGDEVKRTVERSLRLLGLSRLQLVHMHDPRLSTFEFVTGPGGALEALVQLRDEGVIGHLGVADLDVDLLLRYLELGVFETVITHNRYTLLNREAEPLLAYAAQRGIGVCNAAPYGGGILVKGPSADPRYQYHPAPPELLTRARRMEELCYVYGFPLGAVALQFSLSDPRITSTIVGVSRPQRVAQTLSFAQMTLPRALRADIEALGAAGGEKAAE
ncbi:MAG: aldo/keto reductase [Chloroflexota bacterium]